MRYWSVLVVTGLEQGCTGCKCDMLSEQFKARYIAELRDGLTKKTAVFLEFCWPTLNNEHAWHTNLPLQESRVSIFMSNFPI